MHPKSSPTFLAKKKSPGGGLNMRATLFSLFILKPEFATERRYLILAQSDCSVCDVRTHMLACASKACVWTTQALRSHTQALRTHAYARAYARVRKACVRMHAKLAYARAYACVRKACVSIRKACVTIRKACVLLLKACVLSEIPFLQKAKFQLYGY